MAFDKDRRNLLAKTVTACRRRLTEDVTDQLKGVFGLHPDGTVLAITEMTHLSPDQAAAARRLRDLLDHYTTGGTGKEKDRRKAAYERMVLEISFTVLNRLAALRLCEERGLVVECVRKGTASAGFQMFERISGGALGGRYDTYRVFLECLFDELALDLGVVFDRTTPHSAVFPTERCVEDVLAELNKPELSHLWTKDETIGWIYQYFNPPEERKAMREASQAPRNSRELAVRNQFFTPRYVVEFLTDNTLGRVWYEMRWGDTALKEECRYLVRRSNEVFLAQGREAPPESKDETDLSREELLKKTVYIEYRSKKNPRDLRVLDPACGSGHFLLYAFDLLERIYEEAWGDPESPKCEATGGTLLEDFETFDDLLKAIPKLIIEQNLHGIDIDPRAVQIAALALWLRAQKTWKKLGLKPTQRPQIDRSNIVTAEPMPGEEDMLREFTAALEPRALGQLVDVVFDKMKLAGEAGSLLKIEEEIKDVVAEAKKMWLEGPKPANQLTFPGMGEPRPKQEQLRFDFKGVSDEHFWEQTEDRILDALKAYAEREDRGHTTICRLFAKDTARGFAFIDLCRKRYDVVLMNPPFGRWPFKFQVLAKKLYTTSHNDMLAAFVDRGGQFLQPRGKLGAITSRTCFFLSSFTRWRENVVLNLLQPLLLADLGHGVMDSAMVEAAAYVLSGPPFGDQTKLSCFQLFTEPAPDDLIFDFVNAVRLNRDISGVFIVDPASFRQIPNAPFAYWVSDRVRRLFSELPAFESEGRVAKIGMSTSDDTRFLRCKWEIDLCLKNRKQLQWQPFAKGGTHSGFYSDIHLMVPWENEGAEIKAWVVSNPKDPRTLHWSRRIANSEFFFLPGITWPLRTTSELSLRAMPAGCIFGHKGPAAFVKDGDREDLLALLSIANSKIFSSLVTLQLAAVDAAARSYEVGVIQSTPVPILTKSDKGLLAGFSARAWSLKRSLDTCTENSHAFVLPSLLQVGAQALKKLSEKWFQIEQSIDEELAKIRKDIDFISFNLYLTDDSVHQTSHPKGGPNANFLRELKCGRNEDNSSVTDVRNHVISVLGYLIGTAFGRWDVRIALDASLAPKEPDPFDPLPVCPPGMLVGPDGLPAKPGHIVSEEWLRARPDANSLPPDGSVEKPNIPDSEYPLRISWDGVLVDAPDFKRNQPRRDDIVHRVRDAFDLLWKDIAHEIEREACDILGISDLRDYFLAPSGFFQDHLKAYTKSRRKAPIYWPLSTASGSYTIWIYYHRLTDQTLYSAVNRYVEPKISEVERGVSRIENDLKAASGGEATHLRDGLNEMQVFLGELRDLREELLRIAALPYKPNLNDGVIINAAPLHNLFRLRSWANETKNVWDKLEKGDYDWAHLAYTIWPDRVREVCKKDRSIAIAHGLEELCEVEAPSPKKKGGRGRKKIEGK